MPQAVDGLLQGIAEAYTLAAAQAEGQGAVRLVEVMHVHPVVGCGFPVGPSLQQLSDQLHLAGAGHPGNINIVAAVPHLQTKVQSPQGTTLTDHLIERLQVVGRSETQLGRLDGNIEIIRLQLPAIR